MKVEEKLLRTKDAVFMILRKPDCDCDISIVSNSRMERLRATLVGRKDFVGPEARKIRTEKVVNVLSFPAPQNFPVIAGEKRMIGEVVVNKHFGAGDYATLAPLLIHGILHLLGYRHDRKRDTIRMENLEKQLWDRISSSDSI